jgi:hypothetical protein
VAQDPESSKYVFIDFQVAQHLSAEPGRHERVLGLLPGRRSKLARSSGEQNIKY